MAEEKSAFSVYLQTHGAGCSVITNNRTASDRLSVVKPNMQSASILIIDDQIESIALLLKFLHGHDFDVLVATDGRDGMRKALEGSPDVILLDVSMPQIGGFEVCRQLKANDRTAPVPVIFLSANNSTAHKLEGFAAGGVDYIGKPFSSEEVVARIYVQLKARTELSALRRQLVVDQPSYAATNTKPENQLVDRVLQILHESGFEWQGMEALSRKAGANEKKITELFRQRLGISVFEYVSTLQLEAARLKLAATRIQIQLIGEEAGYRNAGDFSRAFRTRYGLGPRQYRQAFNPDPD